MKNQNQIGAENPPKPPLHLKKIWLPILCGLVITGFLFHRSGKLSSEVLTLLSRPNWHYFSMALLAVLLREIGHIYRYRILSGGSLSWTSCAYVAILLEFGTNVTPSVVGGGLVAIFLLSKEGLSLGKAMAYIILTGLMDNLCFLIAGSFGFFGVYAPIFDMAGSLGSGVKSCFFIMYIGFLLYSLVLAIGVFISPKLLKWMLIHLTSMGWLKRWRRSAYQLSKDLMRTSNEFRGKNFLFWGKMLLCTFFTWMVRHMLLSCLMAAYTPVSFTEHLAIWGRQIVMWTLMLVPISPGGSGIAEVWFEKFFQPMLGDYTLPILLLWRMANFYLYLVLGGILLPKWFQRQLKSKVS